MALLAALTVLASVATSASASAATTVYGGKADEGGRIAFDVRLDNSGSAKQITGIRGLRIPGHCVFSGSDIPLNVAVEVKIAVDKDGRFEYRNTDPFGNKSSLRGHFGGRNDRVAIGRFVYANHFPAEGEFPEEDCTTGTTHFALARGGRDVEVPPVKP